MHIISFHSQTFLFKFTDQKLIPLNVRGVRWNATDFFPSIKDLDLEFEF